MADYTDPTTGLPMYAEGGKTYLRSANGFVAVPTELAGEYVAAQGYVPATADEVAQRKKLKEQEGLVGGTKAAAKAAAAHTFDAATAVVRVPLQFGAAAVGSEKTLKELENLTGHKLMENLAGIATELTGSGTAEKGSREFKEATKAQYEAHPTATTVAGVAGDIAGGIGLGGAAAKVGAGAASGLARAAGRTVGMAAEGGLYGANMAGEVSYLEDSPLTSQKLLAGMGLGAAFGAGGGLLISGGGLAAKAAKDKLDDVTRKAFGSKAQGAAGKVGDESLEAVAAKAMGGDVAPAPGLGSKLRDVLEDAQSAATGVDKQALKKYGALRWDDEAMRGRDMAFRREEILEGAKGEMTERLTNMVRNADTVMDEVRGVGLKRDHLAKLLADSTPEMVQKQQSTALQHLWKTQDDLAKIAAQADQFGNARLVKDTQKLVAKIGKKIEAGDAADAMSGLDEVKRALQKHRVSLGRSAARNSNAYTSQQAEALGQAFEKMQESVRTGLMDESVWGRAATAQKEINAAWEQWFQHKNMFEQRFLARTGETFQGRGVFEVDPGKVSGFLDKLGRKESALVDKHLRGYIDATDRLTKAVGESFELGDKAARVSEVSGAAKGIAETMTKADKTVAVANQVAQILEAKAEGTWIAAALGGSAAGPAGAAVGALVGAISNPGRQLKAAWGLQNMMGKVDVAIGRNLDEFFATAARKARPVVEGAQKAERLVKRAALPAGLAIERFASEGQTRKVAYEKRREQIAALITSPQRLTEVIQKHVEPVAAVSPGLATQLAMDMTRALMMAQDAAPAEKTTSTLVPKRDKAFVSQQEIDRFADAWEGITSPLSLLEDLRKGQLNYTKRDAVAAAYPDLFAEMQVAALERMAAVDHPMPLQQRTQLDLLMNLGGAGEPSVRPDFLRRQNERAQIQAQKDGGQPPPGRRPMNVSGGAATLSQSLAT